LVRSGLPRFFPPIENFRGNAHAAETFYLRMELILPAVLSVHGYFERSIGMRRGDYGVRFRTKKCIYFRDFAAKFDAKAAATRARRTENRRGAFGLV
jgi:hypothetical protein